MSDIDESFFTGFGECVLGDVDIADTAPSRLSPLVLAFIGDSVYDVFVRGMLAQHVSGNVHKLHLEATKHARCASQADVIRSIYDELTEHEQSIVRRGRNAHSGYVPKNAIVSEYRYATGFEALLGYLFMCRNFNRLSYILNLAAQRVAVCSEKKKVSNAK